jgi:hypothetical protein
MIHETFSPLHFYECWKEKPSSEEGISIGFEVLATIVMIVAMFWDRALCSSYVNDVSDVSTASVFGV